jgi:hypothetical protein
VLAKPPVFGFQNPTLLCFQLVNFTFIPQFSA